ncbi:hypothetical protein AHIS1636_36550 [Arthrobacter mangrovi]|uniref:Uncharacterized protein n=1 Tax=Arthrobacter mangrovi TaxID=2966350 RepID=A0ABQ5MZT1_9MICC|nr:hypothetical protein AHIS1636_36550 [Arthrobacter mangrovi]
MKRSTRLLTGRIMAETGLRRPCWFTVDMQNLLRGASSAGWAGGADGDPNAPTLAIQLTLVRRQQGPAWRGSLTGSRTSRRTIPGGR